MKPLLFLLHIVQSFLGLSCLLLSLSLILPSAMADHSSADDDEAHEGHDDEEVDRGHEEEHDDHGHGGHGDHDEAEDAKGPNGGKLFHKGDITLELKIHEQGVAPQYRAWISDHGKQVGSGTGAQLEVSLTRLGGQVDIIKFNRGADYWLGDGVVEEPHSFDVSVKLTHKKQQLEWEFESYEGRVQIAQSIADRANIITAIAGTGTVSHSLKLYGKTSVDPGKLSHIRARFPGSILNVAANIGDFVREGDVLVEIESNESLRRYQIKAPFDGVVSNRHANPGELAGQQTLLTLVDYSLLWAQLQVFPSQRQHFSKGQNVRVKIPGLSVNSEIKHILPGSGTEPFVIARVPLENTNGEWSPNLMVEGLVEIETREVDLVVDNRALQRFRDWKVVFIQIGNTYEIRPLTLGQVDDKVTEVLAGLNPGDRYVVGNSYLIKADIEKSEASHDH